MAAFKTFTDFEQPTVYMLRGLVGKSPQPGRYASTTCALVLHCWERVWSRSSATDCPLKLTSKVTSKLTSTLVLETKLVTGVLESCLSHIRHSRSESAVHFSRRFS